MCRLTWPRILARLDQFLFSEDVSRIAVGAMTGVWAVPRPGRVLTM